MTRRGWEVGKEEEEHLVGHASCDAGFTLLPHFISPSGEQFHAYYEDPEEGLVAHPMLHSE